MKTLYDKFGRASLRLLHGCFVTYTEGRQVGWLRGEAVHGLDGTLIGRYTGGFLRDVEGMIVAKELGAVTVNGDELLDTTESSESWSTAGCTSFFCTRDADSSPDTVGLGRAS